MCVLFKGEYFYTLNSNTILIVFYVTDMWKKLKNLILLIDVYVSSDKG